MAEFPSTYGGFSMIVDDTHVDFGAPYELMFIKNNILAVIIEVKSVEEFEESIETLIHEITSSYKNRAMRRLVRQCNMN